VLDALWEFGYVNGMKERMRYGYKAETVARSAGCSIERVRSHFRKRELSNLVAVAIFIVVERMKHAESATHEGT